MSNHSLTLPDFARLLGHPEQALPSACRDTIVTNNWQYGWIEGEALDELVAGLLDRIRRRDFSIAIPGDKARWVKGWGENLDEFVASKGDLSALAPKYVRADLPVRLFRRFAQTAEPQFELNWRRVYQQYLFSTYLADCERIYEFGCGSGGHVSVLAQMFPKKKIVGLDWAEPSCEIVNNMHRLHGWNTEGRLFDFYKPDYAIDIPADSVVMTFAALEQISDSLERSSIFCSPSVRSCASSWSRSANGTTAPTSSIISPFADTTFEISSRDCPGRCIGCRTKAASRSSRSTGSSSAACCTRRIRR